jgi:hypothetical protein
MNWLLGNRVLQDHRNTLGLEWAQADACQCLIAKRAEKRAQNPAKLKRFFKKVAPMRQTAEANCQCAAFD